MTAAVSPASSESVSRTDNPSKIIKLDTVRVIAERVSTGMGNLRPCMGTEGSPLGQRCAAGSCQTRASDPHP